MYFQPQQDGRPLLKSDLAPGVAIPQGRKFYLHHRRHDIGAHCWETKNQKRKEMKTCVQPLKERTVFFFHVDFDNLTDEELGLLLYSLRPTTTFRHKLGMGKAIGLGSVRIDVAGVFLINRQQRYSADEIFSGRRYHQVSVEARLLDHETGRQRYARELADANAAAKLEIAPLRAAFQPDPAAQRAIELIGNPNAVTHPVHTPLAASQQDPEEETFKWFVDHGGQRCLQPIRQGDTTLPTLDR